MRKKLFEVSLVTISIFLFVALLVTQPLALPILIGGVITSGILGGFSGKVGPVVGGNWKGIDFMRSYVIPANPNSVDQQAQRSKFSVAIDLARQVLGDLIQPYWDQYQTGKSGFNAVVSEFLSTLDGTNKLTVATKLMKGTLVGVNSFTSTYATSDGAVDLVWTNNAGTGNALGTDLAIIIAYDKVNSKLYAFATANPRSAANATVEMPSGLTATNVIIFLAFSQGTGSQMIVSDSVGDVAAAG